MLQKLEGKSHGSKDFTFEIGYETKATKGLNDEIMTWSGYGVVSFSGHLAGYQEGLTDIVMTSNI